MTFLHCSADEDIDSTFPTNVVVSSNGGCLWVPPGLFKSTCKIDITWFPFDDQQCKMKFGSWTYDASGLNLVLQGDAGDMSSFIPNGEWELVGKAPCKLLSFKVKALRQRSHGLNQRRCSNDTLSFIYPWAHHVFKLIINKHKIVWYLLKSYTVQLTLGTSELSF